MSLLHWRPNLPGQPMAVLLILLLSGLVVAVGIWAVTDEPAPPSPLPKARKKARPARPAGVQAELPLEPAVESATESDRKSVV